MPPDETQAHAVRRFGAFEIDLRSGELRKSGMRLRISGQPFQILAVLVERPGEVVTREELHSKLWPSDTFVDFDHGLNNAVARIREVLDDSSDTPRYVETIPRRGYRFIAALAYVRPATVTPSASESKVSSAHEITRPGASDPSVLPTDRRFSSTRLRVLLGGVTVLILFTLALVLNRGGGAKGTMDPAIKSLVVLPLKNLSGDATQEYLADGMTEALIGRLSRIHDLRVISRTSVMVFKDTRMSAPEIAERLRIDAIVEGSVIREGSRVRVTVQLIRGATDEHIWAEEYEQEYRSILTLQEEVTRTIVQQIKIRLTPQEQVGLSGARAVDPQVHENYLKGRYYFNQRTEDSLNRSIAYFQQAITGDPSYALAYCGLADAYALLGFRGGVPSKHALFEAKTAALKAIELDDTLAEPHASLAFIAETHEWDWATAEREYRRALELNPGDARARHWYAGYLMYVGRFEEGIAEAKRARDLDPLSLPVNNALAGRLLVAGRVDEALKQLQETLEMDPHFAPGHQTLGWAYLNKGKHEEAIQEFQEALQLSGTDDTDLMLDLGFAYAAVGNREEARRILAKLKNLHDRGLVPSGSIGILYGALGELNEAFAWLEKAYEERDPELTYLKVPGRRFEPLRHDPRFQDLVHRVGLPD
ncbi:MAG: Adenylate cyclase [Acidobacteriaceae bacterium]|nr:Adenylate cyclase [Acidobacteriaceae bacterium]